MYVYLYILELSVIENIIICIILFLIYMEVHFHICIYSKMAEDFGRHTRIGVIHGNK